MQDCGKLIRFIGFNKHTSSKSSVRATQAFWCFFSLLVVLSLYTLVWCALSPISENTHPFLFTWLSLLSLLLVHHLISACAEKCEVLAVRPSCKSLRLCRLPTLVRFGGVIFLVAGLIMHIGHTLSHILSFSSAMESYSQHMSEKGKTFSTMKQEQEHQWVGDGTGVKMSPQKGKADQQNSWTGVVRPERLERNHDGPGSSSLREQVKGGLFSEKDTFTSTLAWASLREFFSDVLSHEFYIPAMLIFSYFFLLFIFRAWMLRMDVVVGSAEEDLESLPPLGIEVSTKAFSARKKEDKYESLYRFHCTSGKRIQFAAIFPWLNSLAFALHSRLKNFSPFYKNSQLFVFPAFMLLSCTFLPGILRRGIWSFYVEGFIVLGVTVGILVRSIYVLIPMLRFLMNQNVDAGSAMYSRALMKTLRETIAAIPGVVQVSRYAWWKVGKHEDNRFFLQLKISKEGDAGAISCTARKCLSGLLQADVYVECEQEKEIEESISRIVMNEEDKKSTFSTSSENKIKREEWGYVQEEDKELVIELGKNCNFRMNIPFHYPHHDFSWINSHSPHSHEHSHCAHSHSHKSCH